MERILSNPLRVFLVMLVLGAVGIYCGLSLPISLFPNSSRPGIFVRMGYGSMSPELFRQQYGRRIETSIAALRKDNLRVEHLNSRYRAQEFSMVLTFNWGADTDAAMREARAVVDSVAATLPEEIRRGISFSPEGNMLGMMISFSSQKRSLDEIFRIIEPQLLPRIQAIRDVESAEISNPSDKEIEIVLKPDVLLQLDLTPEDLKAQIEKAVYGQSGGKMQSAQGAWLLSRDAVVVDFDSLAALSIRLKSGAVSRLSDLSTVSMRPSSQSTGLIKTEGMQSLSLLVYPKQGGNLKKVADEIHAITEELQKNIPDDITSKVVLDKSETVKSSIKHVAFEVFLGSLLATIILYLFIGGARNVLTAAIEIPMSMALAFILMKIFDVNINLFSLAGLALAGGMNVDASVVVMENIFRHLDLMRNQEKAESVLKTIAKAVHEVKWPVMISTLASLVVFIPFLALDGMGQALLGDLVKAVIFSHGLSAVVALILVPTFRYVFHVQFGRRETNALADPLLRFMQSHYLRILERVFKNRRLALISLGSVVAALLAMCCWILPRLPTEVVGKPDSDWIIVQFQAEGNTLVRQMEAEIEPFARQIKERIGHQALVRTSILSGPNNGMVAVRIKDKKQMPAIEADMKEQLKSMPHLEIDVQTWNQGELTLPENQAFRLQIAGSTPAERSFAAEDLAREIRLLHLYERIETYPRLTTQDRISLQPRAEIVAGISASVSADGLVDNLRLLSDGRWISDISINQLNTPIVMRYPPGLADSLNKLKSLPVRVAGDVVPLDALFEVKRVPPMQSIVRENGLEASFINGFLNGKNQNLSERNQLNLQQVITKFQKRREASGQIPLTITMADPNPDQSLAIRQLTIALGISLFLLFFTIFLHFGSLIDSLLVMLAVPFAICGSLLSLWMFSSNLSLNSILGMTLLSGIAVNNSIMLVDFIKLAEQAGSGILEATILAAKARLRPIIITSLTTILGMLPIALGFGEGGKVLSPLGISVAGGLLVSTGLTLLFVPILQTLLRSESPEVLTHGRIPQEVLS